ELAVAGLRHRRLDEHEVVRTRRSGRATGQDDLAIQRRGHRRSSARDAQTAYSGSPAGDGCAHCWTSVNAAEAAKDAVTMAPCWASSAACQSATPFLGEQRVLNEKMKGARGRRHRATSRKTSTGRVRYWTDTAHSAASNAASLNGSDGSRLRSWTMP